MGPLGRFWLKRAKGVVYQPLKPQVGPPEAVLAPNTNQPRNGQMTLRTTGGPLFRPWPLETRRGHQLSSKRGFPSSSVEDFSFLNAPCTPGSRSGSYMVQYIIMHHFCAAIQL
ncbi:hypothetical protein O181_056629 [Austropuccinia psidii MF-1]|uniref:Uncharacterized protein n=1 Tax=Austropuccinia psidii MF-1 TaxID=1389203 RepID=A0A9Q3E8U5_9BASI|nr:hypothetical protein [Austropuccinia psidii MF-1]